MDSNLASQSPDTSDIRPSFRKPSNDASHRKYRRHSPLSGSSSPSSSVNKNLGVSGSMSADQKKKLLWGSKKAVAPVEAGSNCWETAHFADPDRQEKFNKLMGVKGELKIEKKVEEKDGLFAAEKQKELQQDLEKQFTAGLRRRDGRTVGLGL